MTLACDRVWSKTLRSARNRKAHLCWRQATPTRQMKHWILLVLSCLSTISAYSDTLPVPWSNQKPASFAILPWKDTVAVLQEDTLLQLFNLTSNSWVHFDSANCHLTVNKPFESAAAIIVGIINTS